MADQGTFSEADSSEDGVFSYAEALELLGGEEDLLIEMVEVLLEQIPELMQPIGEAVRAADADGVNRAAHKLKGSVASLGGRNVARLAQELENAGAAGELSKAPEFFAALEGEVVRLEDAYRAFLDRVGTQA